MKKYLIIITLLFLSSGCANIATVVKKGATLRDEKVILVGKLILDPMLEQKFGSSCGCGIFPSFEEQYENKLFVFLDNDEHHMFTDDLGVICCPHSVMKAQTAIESIQGEYFTVELPREKTFIKGVFVVLTSSSSTNSGLLIRSNIKIDITPEDAFIYIGDFIYTLNKKQKFELQVVDNFNRVKEKYSSFVKSSQAMPVPIQNKTVKNISEIETFFSTMRTTTRAL